MAVAMIRRLAGSVESPEIVDTFFEEFGAFFVPALERLIEPVASIALIVIAALCDDDVIVLISIHQTMFIIDSPTPET